MQTNKKIGHINAICAFLGCDVKEITKYSTNVYGWEGLYYEVVTKHTKTAPDSHYIKLTMGKQEWFIREIGAKSRLMEIVR
jgi:hypothetical protein